MKPPVRVVPRLDVKGPNLIKGICFEGQRVLGAPERFAKRYSDEGADEIVLYDTFASLVQRGPDLELIGRVADVISVPLVVGGGIASLEDIHAVLRAGADKVAINTAAVASPDLLRRASGEFGAQCVVASVEAYRHFDGSCEIWTEYGRQPTGISVERWIEEVIARDVGEILLTSIDRDGTGQGFDLALIQSVNARVSVPVIAGGGAGNVHHLVEAAEAGADAVCAASVLHYAPASPNGQTYLNWDAGELRMGAPVDAGNCDWLNNGYGGSRSVPVTVTSIAEVKAALAARNILVRREAA